MNTQVRVRQYIKHRQDLLAKLAAMWSDKKVQLYNDDALPTDTQLKKNKSVFLAGPTSRNQILECNWRCETVALLRQYGFTDYIYAPEPRGREDAGDFTERSYIHAWESTRLLGATYIAFWIPRKADELLGLNTNLELGFFSGIAADSVPRRERLFVGWPKHAERMGLPKHYLSTVLNLKTHSSLESLCKAIARAS